MNFILQVKTVFHSLVELDDGKATTIYNALIKTLRDDQLAINNLAAFGSDGAAVMVGCRSGVFFILYI